MFKGIRHSEISKKKMREARARFFANGGMHPFKGKKRPSPSIETRAKLRGGSRAKYILV